MYNKNKERITFFDPLTYNEKGEFTMEKLGVLKTKTLFLPLKSDSFNANLWFDDDGQKYMFKYPKSKQGSHHAHINEVLISSLAKQLNIPCQQTAFGSFYGTKGVVVKSFLKDNEEEIPFYKIYNYFMLPKLKDIMGEDFFDEIILPRLEYEKSTMSKKEWEKLPSVKSNDIDSQLTYLMDCNLKTRKCLVKIQKMIAPKIEDIRQLYYDYNTLTDKKVLSYILQYAKQENLSVDNNLKTQLFSMMLLDFVTQQDDRHSMNFSLIKKENSLRLAPLYDNGHCLAFDSQTFRIPKHQIEMTNCFWDEYMKNDNFQRTFFHLKKLLENPEFFFNNFKDKNKDDIINILPKNIKDKNKYIDNYLNLCTIIMTKQLKEFSNKLVIQNQAEKKM